MTIDANSGTGLSMNPVISLFVIAKSTTEMERLFNGLKDKGAILIPRTNMSSYRGFAWVQGKFEVGFRLVLPG